MKPTPAPAPASVPGMSKREVYALHAMAALLTQQQDAECIYSPQRIARAAFWQADMMEQTAAQDAGDVEGARAVPRRFAQSTQRLVRALQPVMRALVEGQYPGSHEYLVALSDALDLLVEGYDVAQQENGE